VHWLAKETLKQNITLAKKDASTSPTKYFLSSDRFSDMTGLKNGIAA
jgi:hypothetical protein